MRRIAFAAAAAGLLLAGPAMIPSLAQSTTETLKEKARSAGETTGINPLLGVSPTTQDFVTEVRRGDTYEVEAHQKSSNDLGGMITAGKVRAEIVPDLDGTRQGRLDPLKGLNGEAFDDAYDGEQVKSPKEAIDLFRRYGEGGDNAEPKAWAKGQLPHLEEHLKQAQNLD